MQLETRTYRLIGITPILGSQPCNPDVRTAYLEKLAPDPVQAKEEAQMSREALARRRAEEKDEETQTVFLRDEKGRIILLDYVIRGFFKSALTSLQLECNVLQARSKVDKYLFTGPRMLHLMRGKEPITDEDAIYERPLRADTMQGPRVALAASERIDDPWWLQVDVMLIPNGGTRSSDAITWDRVETALDFGRLCGLGQFRNGGFGRFRWKSVEPKE